VRHLLQANEILGAKLMTIHNLYHYMELMRRIRDALSRGKFGEFRRSFVEATA
jgi:queuine tRNA-ribosyltransferase